MSCILNHILIGKIVFGFKGKRYVHSFLLKYCILYRLECFAFYDADVVLGDDCYSMIHLFYSVENVAMDLWGIND